MGGRARGANALMNTVFESTYGTTPGSNFFTQPFVSSQLGEERPLIASDLLGLGREPQDPTYDVATNDGDLSVPVDARNFGRWLKLLLGAPTSTGSPAAASQVLTTTANFANGETVTIDGKVYTFQTALTNVDGNVLVGASASASITNLYNAINAVGGGTPGTDYAFATGQHPTVAATAKTTTTLTVSARDGGPAGNAIAVSETGANASWGAGTLAGGAVATHVFKSGALNLPSMSIEIGHPDLATPEYFTHFGVRANQMKIAMSRSGLLNAVMSMIGQGESAPAGSSGAGTPTALLARRFAQATGSIKRNGVVLGSVVGANLTFSNNLDKVETIRADGRIEDADPAMFMASGDVTVKFVDTTLMTQAINGTPIELEFGWTLGDFSLLFAVPRVFLPRTKRPITGPAGIQAQYNWQASGATGNSLVATLINDVAAYTA